MRRGYAGTAVVLAVLGVLVPLSAAAGARSTERWITVNPLDGPSLPGRPAWEVVPSAGFWGEFGQYRFVRDPEHAYNTKLGGFIEMFRIGEDWSLAFTTDIELIANARNLFFRPRALFWEEGFLLTRRAGGRFWQLGYYHRCKHDVDNLQTAGCDDAGGCERSLIHGGAVGKLILPVDLRVPGSQARLVVRSDLFTIVQDDRIPAALAGSPPSVDRLWGAVGTDIHARAPITDRLFGVYATAYGTVHLMGKGTGFADRFGTVERATWHGGVAGGLSLRGRLHLRVGLSYEYLTDTGIDPLPESAHLLMLGVTIIDPATMW